MNLNYISCNYLGGLGNQFFTIYTCLAFAFQYNKIPIFELKDSSPSITFRKTYFDSIFKHLTTLPSNIFQKNIIWNHIIQENLQQTYQLPLSNQNQNILLNGYFQNYHNFENFKTKINNFLQIDSQQKAIFQTYPHFFQPPHIQNIGIHFRLGDYKHLQEHHPLLPNSYYLNALKIILQKYPTTPFQLLIFCEKDDLQLIHQRMQIITTKLNIQHIKCIYINLNNDIHEFFILSLCNFIIIANSTFSWWSAYLNKNQNNIYLPHKWFHEKTPPRLILPTWNIVHFD